MVGQGDWQTQLEQNKNAFALEFVQRPRFTAAFPSTMAADEFVSKLDQNAGGVLSAPDKASLVALARRDPRGRLEARAKLCARWRRTQTYGSES
jgi:hypothetical protein